MTASRTVAVIATTLLVVLVVLMATSLWCGWPAHMVRTTEVVRVVQAPVQVVRVEVPVARSAVRQRTVVAETILSPVDRFGAGWSVERVLDGVAPIRHCTIHYPAASSQPERAEYYRRECVPYGFRESPTGVY